MLCAVQKPYWLILANLHSNKRKKRETLRYSHRFFVDMYLSEREIFHSKKKFSKVFNIFYLSWLTILYEELKNVGLFSQVCVCGSWEKLVTVADFKRHPRQKYGGAQRFFSMIFRDEMMGYKGESKLVF